MTDHRAKSAPRSLDVNAAFTQAQESLAARAPAEAARLAEYEAELGQRERRGWVRLSNELLHRGLPGSAGFVFAGVVKLLRGKDHGFISLDDLVDVSGRSKATCRRQLRALCGLEPADQYGPKAHPIPLLKLVAEGGWGRVEGLGKGCGAAGEYSLTGAGLSMAPVAAKNAGYAPRPPRKSDRRQGSQIGTPVGSPSLKREGDPAVPPAGAPAAQPCGLEQETALRAAHDQSAPGGAQLRRGEPCSAGVAAERAGRQVSTTSKPDPRPLHVVVEALKRHNPPLDPAAIARAAERLLEARDRGHVVTDAKAWAVSVAIGVEGDLDEERRAAQKRERAARVRTEVEQRDAARDAARAAEKARFDAEENRRGLEKLRALAAREAAGERLGTVDEIFLAAGRRQGLVGPARLARCAEEGGDA